MKFVVNLLTNQLFQRNFKQDSQRKYLQPVLVHILLLSRHTYRVRNYKHPAKKKQQQGSWEKTTKLLQCSYLNS